METDRAIRQESRGAVRLSSPPRWWTRSQPIRTAAQLQLAFVLVARPPFVYQQVAEKARELSRLGMSATIIARMLNVTDKTVAKALRHYESGRKGTEPST
jgi:hypothetical protein